MEIVAFIRLIPATSFSSMDVKYRPVGNPNSDSESYIKEFVLF